MDKRWANEQGAEHYPILEAIALEVIEENQRLRAQIGQGVPVAWTTGIKWHPISHYQSEQVQKLTRKAQPEHGFTIPLYTHPAPQQKPLTDEQIKNCLDAADQMYCLRDGDKEIFKARAIEAVHNIGEKK